MFVSLRQSADTSIAPSSIGSTSDEVGAVRAAAQWLVAAAGAVAAILVAGLQLGDIGKRAQTPLLLTVAVLSFLVAMVVVGGVIRRASQVLVVGRTTLSDILNAELAARAGKSRRIRLEERCTKEMINIVNQIKMNGEWLLGHHDSPADLFASYELMQRSREQTSLAEVAKSPSGIGNKDLADKLRAVCDFARSEMTRREYAKLTSFLTGSGGICFSLAVVAFAVSLGWPISEPQRVTTPMPVEVNLIGNTSELTRAGIPVSCLPGSTIPGVAIDGSVLEPVVVTRTVSMIVNGKASRCPTQQLKATKDLAVVVPVLPR